MVSAAADREMVASEFHLVASEPEGLGRMRDGDLSLVVWQRLLPTRLGPAMRRWAGLEPPRLERPLFASSRWIDDALAGFAPGSARAFLEADLALHVERFGRIAGTTRVQISFGVVAVTSVVSFTSITDACA